MSQKNKVSKCITCNKEIDNNISTIPFCSKRCSYVDLNNWLDEKYFIKMNEEDYQKDV